jgi:hypothetical protein
VDVFFSALTAVFLADVRTVFRFAPFFAVFFADDLIGLLMKALRLLKNKKRRYAYSA